MDYITTVNSFLKKEISNHKKTVVYGQNINAGSRLGGFSKGLDSIEGCQIINTPNVENSLVGMGFGLMLKDIPSVFIMKQQDFILLGIDHLVNTWNAIKSRGPFVPFVIAMIVVDNGWEGPQSSYNNLFGLSNLSGLETYSVNGQGCIESAISKAFSGGPRILGVSQKMFKEETPEIIEEFTIEIKSSYITYSKLIANKNIVVIISFNFSFNKALELAKEALSKGMSVVIIVSYVSTKMKLDPAEMEICIAADKIFILDDTKNLITQGELFHFSRSMLQMFPKLDLSIREDECNWNVPQLDELSVTNKMEIIKKMY